MFRLALGVAAAFASVAARAEVGDWRWFEHPASPDVQVEMSHTALARPPYAAAARVRQARRPGRTGPEDDAARCLRAAFSVSVWISGRMR